MPITCTYTNCSTIYSYNNISSNTVTSSMVQECINRAGWRVNSDLGADSDGTGDYTEFQSSDSAGLSYVPANTLALIKVACNHLANAYTMTFENAPDMDSYTEVDGALVQCRKDTKNEARKKYYYTEYARIIDMLQDSDIPDDYFGNRRNRSRRIIMCDPDPIEMPPGNPL